MLAGLAGLGLGTAGPAAEPDGVGTDLFLAQAASAPSLGQRFQSESGRYSVLVPLGTQATRPTTVNGQTLTWTVSTARQGDTVYGVAYTDLPLEMLAMGQEAVIESLKARPFWAEFDWEALGNRGQRVSLGDVPGIEFVHLAEGRTSVVRFFLANRRLYAVMASAMDLHSANQFVASFAIDDLWRPFVSEAGQFSVDLPMAPVFTPQQVTYQGTTLDWWQYVGYNLYAPGDRYGFAYADLPSSLNPQDPDALLQAVATLVLTELDAPHLVTQGTVIALGEMPGREYLLTKPDGQSYVLRLYLGDRRLYGLLATSDSLGNLDRFLSSFQVP